MIGITQRETEIEELRIGFIIQNKSNAISYEGVEARNI